MAKNTYTTNINETIKEAKKLAKKKKSKGGTKIISSVTGTRG